MGEKSKPRGEPGRAAGGEILAGSTRYSGWLQLHGHKMLGCGGGQGAFGSLCQRPKPKGVADGLVWTLNVERMPPVRSSPNVAIIELYYFL